MSDFIVDVTNEGAILLGPDIVCDGFFFGPKARVQTHIHQDHMEDFDRSKGLQKIFLSHETYSLLIFEKNADIPIRSNIRPLDYGKQISIGDSTLKLLPSGHMIGAVQVEVILPDGTTAGYSGDFKYPIEQVINVDTLIVDSSCGSIEEVESYSEKEVMEKFLELIVKSIRKGPIQITAHRGILHKALDILDMELDIPIVANEYLIQESKIYSEYGYSVPEIICHGNKKCEKILRSGKFILIRSTYGHNPTITSPKCTHIVLRRHADKKNPVRKTESNTYAVGLSGHSNLEETLAYIQETGASYVITDNYRGQRAVELAYIIQERLGIEARASTNEISHNWR